MMMKKLGISIPNYNRIRELERLLYSLISQIMQYKLTDEVQICVRDDCSSQNPTSLIYKIQSEYPMIDIKYHRNKENQGMDWNFLGSVLMADTEYSWIIGNDDMPTENGVVIVLDYLFSRSDVDFLVTPFDVYSQDEMVLLQVKPINRSTNAIYRCSFEEERNRLFFDVQHNGGLFAFLSNVVFRRNIWTKNYEKFKNKMNSIFIQVYLNLNAIFEGATYHYLNEKIIKNYADPEMNDTLERMSKILFGLDDIVEYFFKDQIKIHLKEVITDGCINGVMWSLPESSEIKQRLRRIESPKNEYYKKYYMNDEEIGHRLVGEKVVIYGAGNFGYKSLKRLQKDGVKVDGVADGSDKKVGTIWNGYNILSVEEMIDFYSTTECYIVVASHDYLTEMVRLLEKNGVKKIAMVC